MSWKVDVVCLQGTNTETVLSIRGNQFVDWLHWGSGGIWMLWDTRIVVKIDEFVGEYSISC